MEKLIYFLIAVCLSNMLYAIEVSVPPLRKNEFGGSLGDIDCRMHGGPNYDWKNYRDDDKATWGHEGTHSINARIRNRYKIDNDKIEDTNKLNGYYLLNGRGVLLSNPVNLTLSEVARNIPKDKRGSIYKLYMVDQQKHWNKYPLYCYDEWVAYINGAVVALEHNMSKRALESYKHAREMQNYCHVALELSESKYYKDGGELRKLYNFLNHRMWAIKRGLDKIYPGKIKWKNSNFKNDGIDLFYIKRLRKLTYEKDF